MGGGVYGTFLSSVQNLETFRKENTRSGGFSDKFCRFWYKSAGFGVFPTKSF